MQHSEHDITELREAAITVHEMYTELVAAGFNRAEALYLCGNMMVQSGRDMGPDFGG